MVHMRTRRTRGWTRMGAVLSSSASLAGTLVAAGVSPAGAEKSGGDLRFGLEAESTGGFCLNQAQLVTSGKQVAAAIYDTLTVPNTKGEYVPYPRRVGHSQRHVQRVDDQAAAERQVPRRHAAQRRRGPKQNLDGWKTGRLFSFVYGNMDQSPRSTTSR